MPELPEVETIRRDLIASILNKKILRVEVLHRKTINVEPQKFIKQLQGQKIEQLLRHGKVLQIGLSSGQWLVAHLKMTGQFIAQYGKHRSGGGHPTKLGVLPDKTTRLIFYLSDGTILFFNDTRLFGWVHLMSEVEREAVLKKLGPDALDMALGAKIVVAYIRRYSNRLLKAMLLDQGLFAGIGNIYADEICFDIGLKPSRLLKKIKSNDVSALIKSIKKILQSAVRRRGTTFRNFVDGSGQPGKHVSHLQAYGRAGEPCRRCGAILKKIVVVQRGTTYCPKCQR